MSVVYFQGHELRLASRQLLFDARPLKIGARAFDILAILIEAHDQIVSREEIMAKVWPNTVVGDNNLNVQIANLRKLLGAEAIRTVPGRGLQFTLPVSTKAPAGIVADLSDKPSVVVLPFLDLSPEQDQSWLIDGFLEEITTALSRFRDLFVISRNSAATFRQYPRNLRDISGKLGVRYVIEGSVRLASSTVRVTAQLIDAHNGSQIWAENFDGDSARHFDTQQQIARRVVTSLVPQIDRAEAARVATIPPGDLTAYGVAQQAWAMVSANHMDYDDGPRTKALDLVGKALAMDQRSALAWRTAAWLYWGQAFYGTGGTAADMMDLGLQAADTAIAIDPMDHHARRLRGLFHIMAERSEAGLADLRRAREINPNCAITLSWNGFFEATHGDHTISVPLAEAALELSPADPLRAAMLVTLGFTQFSVGDYEAAVSSAESAMAEAPNGTTPQLLAAVSYVGDGQFDNARKAYNRLAERAPKLAETRLAGTWLATNPDYLNRTRAFIQIAAGLADPATVGEFLSRD